MNATPWHFADPVPAKEFAEIRLRTVFDHCKWDPQVGDVSILSDAPLVLEPAAWREVSGLAEKLAAEAAGAEAELVRRPDLQHRLGLPWVIRRALAGAGNGRAPRGVARLIRFDFHYTTEGWRISEANTDVPGGFIESSGFTRLVAAHCPGASPCGDPSDALAAAVAASVSPNASAAMIHATAYTDDRQVMVYLARHLEAKGLRTHLAAPDQLAWTAEGALLRAAGCAEPLDVLVRFYPGEWLPNLPRASGWPRFFGGSPVALCNPATALLTQSKRFPLAWDDLATRMDTWRALLPETRDPREADVRWDGDWVLKPVFGRVGESIGFPGLTPGKEWRKIARDARRWPRYWAAQRRFEHQPVPSGAGPRYVCLGVYTVDGRAVGAYGRVGRKPLIDGVAQDAAVLVRNE